MRKMRESGGRCIDCGSSTAIFNVGKMQQRYCGCTGHSIMQTGNIDISAEEFMQL